MARIYWNVRGREAVEELVSEVNRVCGDFMRGHEITNGQDGIHVFFNISPGMDDELRSMVRRLSRWYGPPDSASYG